MGTDATGMDIFSRVIYAPRIDLAIALAGTLLSAVIGSLLGAAAGYYEAQRGFGTFVSGTRSCAAADVLQAFPVFVFAIAVVAVIGQSLHSIVHRHRLRERPDLSPADAQPGAFGAPAALCRSRLYRRHLGSADPDAPCHPKRHRARCSPSSRSMSAGRSCSPPASASSAPACEAPTPEWGSMIAMGYQNIVTGHWWPSIFPGLALAVTVFGFSLIGSSVEVLADPVRRQRLAGQSAPAPGSAAADGASEAPGRCCSLYRPPPHFRRPAARRHPAGQLPPGEAHPGRSGGDDARPVRDRRRAGAPARRARPRPARCFEQFGIYLWRRPPR